jgi:hypothetical protein
MTWGFWGLENRVRVWCRCERERESLKEEDERAEDAILSLGGARPKGRKEKERLHGPSFQGPYPLHFFP